MALPTIVGGLVGKVATIVEVGCYPSGCSFWGWFQVLEGFVVYGLG